MTNYSVAAAKAGLPGLINRAIAGEDVVITRHGKPVAELRATAARGPDRAMAAAAFERLRSHRIRLEPDAPNSVELLNLIYDDPDG